jgi:hypothetical protein
MRRIAAQALAFEPRGVAVGQGLRVAAGTVTALAVGWLGWSYPVGGRFTASPGDALRTGAIVGAGALLQTVLAALLQKPRHVPRELEALAGAYRSLSEYATILARGASSLDASAAMDRRHPRRSPTSSTPTASTCRRCSARSPGSDLAAGRRWTLWTAIAGWREATRRRRSPGLSPTRPRGASTSAWPGGSSPPSGGR